MKHLFSVLAVVLVLVFAQGRPKAQAQGPAHWQADLTQPQPYVLKRVSSADPTGGNADFRSIEPGATLTVFDVDGPAVLTHLWFTLYDPEPYHLKKLVLRMYWDGEAKQKVSFFYFNLDYRAPAKPLPADTLYFHAQFRQAQPNLGWTNKWESNGDPLVEDKKNLDGEGNYVWMEAKGRGQFVGVTMSVLQNQDGWWGEGDDMFFIDGESRPSINGTGSEDYFLGAFDFGRSAFSYRLYGAPVKGEERAGSRSSVYRFHLDSPVPFTKSIRATIEHGHANHRSDNYYSVAYWYQTEPHVPFPVLPSVEQRIPRLQQVGGPGNPAVVHP